MWAGLCWKRRHWQWDRLNCKCVARKRACPSLLLWVAFWVAQRRLNSTGTAPCVLFQWMHILRHDQTGLPQFLPEHLYTVYPQNDTFHLQYGQCEGYGGIVQYILYKLSLGLWHFLHILSPFFCQILFVFSTFSIFGWSEFSAFSLFWFLMFLASVDLLPLLLLFCHSCLLLLFCFCAYFAFMLICFSFPVFFPFVLGVLLNTLTLMYTYVCLHSLLWCKTRHNSTEKKKAKTTTTATTRAIENTATTVKRKGFIF